MLGLIVSQPTRLGVRHPPGAHDQIFFMGKQLQICGASSLKRGRVFSLQLLMGLLREVIFGSESRWTHDHILLLQKFEITP
jgi:hypothetical protein